jgi:hypothetical protein
MDAADDSNTDRIVLHAAVDRINERCESHAKYEAETSAWMRDADRDLSRIKFLGVLTLALLGVLGASARWLVGSAVTAALVEHRVLELAQPHARIETPATKESL